MLWSGYGTDYSPMEARCPHHTTRGLGVAWRGVYPPAAAALRLHLELSSRYLSLACCSYSSQLPRHLQLTATSPYQLPSFTTTSDNDLPYAHLTSSHIHCPPWPTPKSTPTTAPAPPSSSPQQPPFPPSPAAPPPSTALPSSPSTPRPTRPPPQSPTQRSSP